MIKKIIKKIVSKIFKTKTSEQTPKEETRFPYLFHQIENDVCFNINNHIEEFRLKDWGGELEYVSNMISKLKNNDIFLDVGSSVGLISIIASKHLTEGKVISIEPDPENKQKLQENYKINNLMNYSILQIAVGDTIDKLLLYTSGSNGYSPSLQKVNGIESTIEVDVNTIDNLLESNLIDLPTVVKIDIEGAEFMALKGMEKLLNSIYKPRLIFVEIHPEFLPAFNTNVEEIMSYMNNFNYKLSENIIREKQILCEFIAQ
jgi:FkbM family methyltransferase